MFKSQEIKDFMKHKFDFDHQIKNNYDDWTKAFELAVGKRAEDNCFTGLSSGYDSGILTYEMKKQKIKFKTYTIPVNENKEIINKRLKYIDEFKITDLSQEMFDNYKHILKKKIKNDKYIIRYNGIQTDMRILDDRASMGGAFMCDCAKMEGRKVYISTQGCDEIISDYSLIPDQSEFKGVFPDELKEWWNFRKGCNYSYLMKEERIPEVFGIETRCPFIDIDLVQEFLWLKPELKNKYYKAPLRKYLITNKIPFEENVKRGFCP